MERKRSEHFNNVEKCWWGGSWVPDLKVCDEK